MGKFLTDKPLPKAELKQPINDTDLVKILTQTAEKLKYNLDMKFEFCRKVEPLAKRDYTYYAEIYGRFSAEEVPNEIEFRVKEALTERITKRPYFGLIEIIRMGGDDITEKYVNLGIEVIETFKKFYKKHSFQSNVSDRSDGGRSSEKYGCECG